MIVFVIFMDIFNLFGGCLFVKVKKSCGSSVKIDRVQSAIIVSTKPTIKKDNILCHKT
jgi:hypothetical protein